LTDWRVGGILQVVRNCNRRLVIVGLACLVVAACSGTDASGLTAAVQGTANGGAAGASGNLQGGSAGLPGAGGSAGTVGGGGAAGTVGAGGSAGTVGGGGAAGASGTGGSGGVAGTAAGGGSGGTGGVVGAGGSGGVAGAGGSGGVAGAGGSGGVAGAGGSGGVAGTAGSGGVAGTGGDVDAGGAGGNVPDAAPDVPTLSVVYGQSASKTNCVAGDNSFSHTLDWGSGNNRIVIVGALMRGNLAAPRYNGVTMTQLTQRFSGNNSWRVTLYYLLDAQLPTAAGTYPVTAGANTTPMNCFIDVSSFAHVDQSHAPANNTHESAVPGSYTDGIANPTTGSMAYDFIGSSQGTLTAGAGQTVVTDLAGINFKAKASYRACGGDDPCDMTWDPEASNPFTYAWLMALLTTP
jgi:hypothetical protein